MKSNRELNRAGYGAGELGRMVRDGRLERIRRGVYDDLSELDSLSAHRRLLRATLECCAEGAVVSHVSAAVLHGLPCPRTMLKQVHLTRPHKAVADAAADCCTCMDSSCQTPTSSRWTAIR